MRLVTRKAGALPRRMQDGDRPVYVGGSANITSIALATAIVTATMASLGYAPSLGDISGAPHAFISGLRTAFLGMVALLVVGMVFSHLNGGRVEEIPALVPQPQTSGSPSD